MDSPRRPPHRAGLLSVAPNRAFRLDMIPVNPMLKVEPPAVQPHEARSLTPEEIARLCEVCRDDWTFACIEVDLATGARRGELLALTWPDINWIGRQITISKSVEQTKAGLRIKGTKGNKPRTFFSRRAQLPRYHFSATSRPNAAGCSVPITRPSIWFSANPMGTFSTPLSDQPATQESRNQERECTP